MTAVTYLIIVPATLSFSLLLAFMISALFSLTLASKALCILPLLSSKYFLLRSLMSDTASDFLMTLSLSKYLIIYNL